MFKPPITHVHVKSGTIKNQLENIPTLTHLSLENSRFDSECFIPTSVTHLVVVDNPIYHPFSKFSVPNWIFNLPPTVKMLTLAGLKEKVCILSSFLSRNCSHYGYGGLTRCIDGCLSMELHAELEKHSCLKGNNLYCAPNSVVGFEFQAQGTSLSQDPHNRITLSITSHDCERATPSHSYPRRRLLSNRANSSFSRCLCLHLDLSSWT